MKYFWTVTYCLVASSLMASSQGPDIVVVTVPNVGVLRGKEVQTVGNLEHPQKTYYSFRNIPYGQGVSNDDRFKQPTRFQGLLGSDALPYDATKTGPLCYQGSVTEEWLDDFNSQKINVVVRDIVTRLLGSLPGNVTNESPLLAFYITEVMIQLLEDLLEVDLDGKTLGQITHDWLDVSLSVSEDCLHLAVYTPIMPHPDLSSSSSLLPVMFFIHGGAFFAGSQLKMDASRLGHVADVVVVAVNFRMGPLGFMCLDTDEAAGNMGLLDMVLALEWVRDNIAAFGGDPERITIFGESAGSASVGHLMLSSVTQGLFAQVIGQSGSAVSPWAFDRDPEFHSRSIAAKLGCNKDNHDEIVACMRNRTANQIAVAHQEYYVEKRAKGELGFGGTVPCAQTRGAIKFYGPGENPEDILAHGDYKKLPIFFGANSHEGSFIYAEIFNSFLLPNHYHNDTDFLSHHFVTSMLQSVGVEQSFVFKKFLQKYYFREWQMGNLEHMTPGAIDLLSTFFVKASSYHMVEQNSRFSSPSFWYSVEHAAKRKSLLNYHFSGDKKPTFVDDSPGVSHADELMYLFNLDLPIVLCDVYDFFEALLRTLINECEMDMHCVTNPEGQFKTEWNECLKGELTQEEQVWSDRMVRAWTNFATHGHPTPEEGPSSASSSLPFLPAWTVESPVYLAFRREGAVVAEDYTLTYDQVVRDSLTTTERPVETTTTSGATGTSWNNKECFVVISSAMTITMLTALSHVKLIQ